MHTNLCVCIYAHSFSKTQIKNCVKTTYHCIHIQILLAEVGCSPSHSDGLSPVVQLQRLVLLLRG